MKKYVDGKYIEMTPEEISQIEAEAQKIEADYWRTIDYDEAVNTEIRKRYSDSQEYALLRQRDKKPEEFAAYDAYCEQCKTHVKEMKTKYGEVH